MPYRIVFKDGSHANIVPNREVLLKALDTNTKPIEDIQKLYKSGAADSVMEKYEKYIKEGGSQ